MPQTILTNARLVLETEVITGTLVLEDGLIAEMSQGASRVPGAVNCVGDFLAPGLIELHTDNLERHMTPRPGVNWPHAPAIIAHDAELASVGITTVFDALRIGFDRPTPVAPSAYKPYARAMATEILEMRALGALKISHFLHLRAEVCSETLEEEFAEFGADDRVGIVSLMDHTPGQRQFTDLAQLRTYMRGKHAMTEAAFEAHVAQRREIGDRMRARHVAAAVEGAARLGAHLASHDDTTEEHVRQSRANGATLAEFPTTPAAARACRAAGIAIIMGAPNLIRGGSHSGNVSASALAEEGLVDILSSDYAPSSLLTGAVMLGEQAGNMAVGLARVSANPARAAGLADRGRLEVGLRADVIRFRQIGAAAALKGAWVQGERV